jgi:serine/threonine-protein kinase
VALQHVRTQPERLENLRPDLPPALSRIIHKMLAKDPGERFANPREMLKELRSLQIDGVDMQWPAELDEINGVEVASLLALRGEATQRLQDLMQTQALVTRKNRKRLWYAAAFVIGAMLLGAGAAWATRERFLLEVPQSELPKVARKETAQLQYEHAEFLQSEAGWKAVIDNFGEDPRSSRHVNRSKQELAKLYLPTDMKRAEQVFEELAAAKDASPDWEKEFRAFGLAGLAFTNYRVRNFDESNKQLNELSELVGGLNPRQLSSVLNDDEMIQVVGLVVQSVRKGIDDKKAQEWKEFLMELPLDQPNGSNP